MKTAHIPQATQHNTGAVRHGQGNGLANGKPAQGASGFAQMLLSGLGDDGSLDTVAAPSTTDNGETSLSNAATTDPLAQLVNPAQTGAMAMLLQTPVANTPATPVDTTDLPATASGSTSPLAPATTTLFNPAGHAMPSQATATGLQRIGAEAGAGSDTGKETGKANGGPVEALTKAQQTVVVDADVAVTPPSTVVDTPLTGRTETPISPQASAATASQPTTTPAASQAQAMPDLPVGKVTVGRRVAAAAKDASTGTPPPQTLAAAAGSDATISWHMTTSGQPGSGLASTDPTPVNVSDSLLSAAANASRQDSSSTEDRKEQNKDNNPQLQATQGLSHNGNATNGSDATTASNGGFAMSLGQAMGDAFETLGAQVSFWAAQNTKHASMNLDAGLDSPLGVDVTLDNGQVQIAFRTDDAAAQAAIKSHAQAALSDLLARSGIGLAGLSVGTQNPQGQNQQAPGQNNWSGLARGVDRVSNPSEAAPATRVTTLRSQRGLDLYA